jgi:hypothetical protein
MRFLCALLALLMVLPGIAAAHETTRSYLTISRNQTALTATLSVAFRDIEVAVWLDDDLDGSITWAETTARLPKITSYVTAGLQLQAGGDCALSQTGQSTATNGGIDYLELTFSGQCPNATKPLQATSRLFAEIDPDHRMFLTAASGGSTSTLLLGGQTPSVTLDPVASGFMATFLSYAQAGMAHLFGGADHIVFLFVLILPAVAMAGSGRQALIGVLLAATGFTVAHAMTLTAATTGLLRPRTDVIEFLVAMSIVVTAADNIRPFLPAPRAVVAAFFGLIHGFGFATALGGLSLTSGTLATALLGFNLGIEAAQIAIIAALMPALYVLRAGSVLVWVGSGAAILGGLYWAGLRVLGWL